MTMTVKRSTHAFSNAKPEPNPVAKSEGVNTAGAQDFSKAFGDQNVGDVLNKIADPNWVDPAKKMRTTGNDKLDKDAFMKLMITQMKYQDPTKPMESDQMAAQLAQFTSLEQLNNINSTLENMARSQSPNSNFQVLAMIGKKVSGDSSKLTRTAGDTKHEFNFDMMNDAIKVQITVKDAAGNDVRKMDFSSLKKGQNSIEWNGLKDDGTPARPGEYKFVVDAKNANGQKVYAKTMFEGKISGLNYTPEGPVLMVGSKTIKLSDVKKIVEPGPEEMMATTPLAPMAAKPAPLKPEVAKAAPAKEQAEATQAVAAQPANSQAVSAPADDEIPPAEEPTEQPGNIGDLPMSRELQQQLAKVMK